MKENELKFNDYYMTYQDKKYYFDIMKFSEICAQADKQDNREREITEAYQLNDNNELELSSKINRELKVAGNTQNEIMVYDIIKIFLGRVLDDFEAENETSLGISIPLAFNTLLRYGLIVEIKE